MQLDPTNPALPVTVIGDFDCINSSGNTGTDTSMNDIAVDAQGSLWGVSAHAVHPLTIQGSTVHCEQQISIQSTTARFYALTFAPVGVLSTTAEVLVAGDSAGALWSIDAGGNITQHGKFGPVPADDGHGHAYGERRQGLGALRRHRVPREQRLARRLRDRARLPEPAEARPAATR